MSNNSSISHASTEGMMPSADPGKSWSERVNTTNLAPDALIYDVIFPSPGSLGILLENHCIAGTRASLGCLAVRDIAPDHACRATLKPLIKAGDVLLAVNSVPLFGQAHDFSRDSAVSAIQKAATPRRLRFIRAANATHPLCPKEMELACDTAPVPAFQLESTAAFPAGVLKQIEMDTELPEPLRKKLLLGRRMVWEECFMEQGFFESQLLLGGVKPFKQESLRLPLVPQQQNAKDLGDADRMRVASMSRRNCGKPMKLVFERGTDYQEGVFRDRDKFAVQLKMPESGVVHYLGRYDSEQEAVNMSKRAHDELRVTGSFAVKKFKSGSVYRGPTAELYKTVRPFALETLPRPTAPTPVAAPVAAPVPAAAAVAAACPLSSQ